MRTSSRSMPRSIRATAAGPLHRQRPGQGGRDQHRHRLAQRCVLRASGFAIPSNQALPDLQRPQGTRQDHPRLAGREHRRHLPRPRSGQELPDLRAPTASWLKRLLPRPLPPASCREGRHHHRRKLDGKARRRRSGTPQYRRGHRCPPNTDLKFKVMEGENKSKEVTVKIGEQPDNLMAMATRSRG